MAGIATKAKQIVSPIIENLGYEVVEVNYKKIYGQDTLEILIHRANGITLDDCVAVNGALDALLDEYDITRGKPYNLNISSIGLDRALVTLRDFQRRLDSVIEVRLRQPIENKYKVIGKLLAVDEEGIQLDINGSNTAINLENIKSAKPHIDFGGSNDK